jgi:hypothetical protein
VSALILDAGALVAVDNDDRAMIARLRASQQQGLELRTMPWSSLRYGVTGMASMQATAS